MQSQRSTELMAIAHLIESIFVDGDADHIFLALVGSMSMCVIGAGKKGLARVDTFIIGQFLPGLFTCFTLFLGERTPYIGRSLVDRRGGKVQHRSGIRWS